MPCVVIKMSKHHKNIINYRSLYETFKGKIPDGYHIHHIDGNPYNNDIDNLIALSPDEHYEIHKTEFIKWANQGGKLGGKKAKENNLGFFSATPEMRSEWQKNATKKSNTPENIEKRVRTYKERLKNGTIKHWTENYSKEEVSEKISSGDPGKSKRGKEAWNKGVKMNLKNKEEINKKKSLSALNRKKFECKNCLRLFDAGNLVQHSKKCLLSQTNS